MGLIIFAVMYGMIATLRWGGHPNHDGKFESNALVRVPRWLGMVLFLSRKGKKQPLWLVLPQILNLLVLPFLPWNRLAESINAGFYYKTIPFYCQCAAFAGFFIFMVMDEFIFWWHGKYGQCDYYDSDWRGKKK